MSEEIPDLHVTIPYRSPDPVCQPIRASFVALYIAVFFAVGVGLAALTVLFRWLAYGVF